MEHKVLFAASTYSHIANFHRPYLRAFSALGWTVDVACGGKSTSRWRNPSPLRPTSKRPGCCGGR